MAYYAVKYSDELYHHGILGQKWGVRRYKNKDGTLTEEGKKRYSQLSKDYAIGSNIGKNVAGMARTGSGFANRISSRKQTKAREKAKSKIDTSNMSNKELQDAITRMNLERQYKDLKTSELSNGRSATSDILADIGDVVAIGAGIAGIAASIYTIKNK